MAALAGVRCIVGVVNERDHREATLAVRGGLIVAFAGVLDNPALLEEPRGWRASCTWTDGERRSDACL